MSAAPCRHSRSELLVLACLAGAGVLALAFVVLYALDVPSLTQWLGLALGGAFALLAAACLIVGRRLVPQDELEEDYPQPLPPAQEDVVEIVEESKQGFTRRRLLATAGGGAAAALGLALLTPLVSAGPLLETDLLRRSPWARGRRLVDAQGRPLLARTIELDALYTAYPEGAERDDIAAPLAVVRLEPLHLDLPAGRGGWAPGGILAYSKVCTHAACAVSEFRTPLFQPTSPRPALVCPCHYSTFDPATGGTVIFGPAGRPLPQLPLLVDDEGYLRAGGGFSAPPGPSWWGVRRGAT